MRVWIVQDQDHGSDAATVTAVFTSVEAAQVWLSDHGDEAFGSYELAAPVDWDGTDEGAAFEVFS